MEQIGSHSVYSKETETWGPLFTFNSTSPLWLKSVQKNDHLTQIATDFYKQIYY